MIPMKLKWLISRKAVRHPHARVGRWYRLHMLVVWRAFVWGNFLPGRPLTLKVWFHFGWNAWNGGRIAMHFAKDNSTYMHTCSGHGSCKEVKQACRHQRACHHLLLLQHPGIQLKQVQMQVWYCGNWICSQLNLHCKESHQCLTFVHVSALYVYRDKKGDGDCDTASFTDFTV